MKHKLDYITNSDKANIHNTKALDDPDSLVPSPIPKLFGYIQNPDKTENNELIAGYECFPELADEQFATAYELYEINTGRTQKANSRLLYHLRQSFTPGEVDPQTANRIGRELALEFTGGNHMFVVATHTDRAHVLSSKRCSKHLLFFYARPPRPQRFFGCTAGFTAP